MGLGGGHGASWAAVRLCALAGALLLAHAVPDGAHGAKRGGNAATAAVAGGKTPPPYFYPIRPWRFYDAAQPPSSALGPRWLGYSTLHNNNPTVLYSKRGGVDPVLIRLGKRRALAAAAAVNRFLPPGVYMPPPGAGQLQPRRASLSFAPEQAYFNGFGLTMMPLVRYDSSYQMTPALSEGVDALQPAVAAPKRNMPVMIRLG